MELTREQVDALPGATLLEFGTDWCGFCQAARPLIDELLGEQPVVPRRSVTELRHALHALGAHSPSPTIG